jgi:hypothetical protein
VDAITLCGSFTKERKQMFLVNCHYLGLMMALRDSARGRPILNRGRGGNLTLSGGATNGRFRRQLFATILGGHNSDFFGVGLSKKYGT